MQKDKINYQNKGTFTFEKGGILNDYAFQKKHNLKLIVSEKDTVNMFNNSFLYPKEILNNSHIYVRWADYIFFNGKKDFCPIKKCAECPTRAAHMSYSANRFGYTNKKKFLDNRFDKRWYILMSIPPKNLKELFEKFILELINDPKSTGNKRAFSSINTYISQIKKWEKNVNEIMNTQFNITADIKNKIKDNFSNLNILEPEMLNKIIDCVLNDSIWRNKLIQSRVKSIFFLMIQTGIRQTEIINLNKSNYSQGMLKISQGKLTRRVALNGNTKRLLDEYLANRFDSNESLFVNQDFQRITKSTVENGWKRISSTINVHFSSMDIRKTSAVLFAKSGSTVDELKDLYGFRTKQIATKYFKEGVERRSLERQKEFDPLSQIN